MRQGEGPNKAQMILVVDVFREREGRFLNHPGFRWRNGSDLLTARRSALERRRRRQRQEYAFPRPSYRGVRVSVE